MEFNFDFRKSIEIARENQEKGFLMQEKFWIPKDNKFFKEFIDIINCAGGIIIEDKEPNKECIILLGSEQDSLIEELKKKNLKYFQMNFYWLDVCDKNWILMNSNCLKEEF